MKSRGGFEKFFSYFAAHSGIGLFAKRAWGLSGVGKSIEHFDIAGYAVLFLESLKILVRRYQHYLGEIPGSFVFESRNLFAGADAASDCRVEVLVIM